MVRLRVLAATSLIVEQCLGAAAAGAVEEMLGVGVAAERAAIRLSICCSVDFMLVSTTDWTVRSIVAMLGIIVVGE